LNFINQLPSESLAIASHRGFLALFAALDAPPAGGKVVLSFNDRPTNGMSLIDQANVTRACSIFTARTHSHFQLDHRTRNGGGDGEIQDTTNSGCVG
jgi:hypothetical protein